MDEREALDELYAATLDAFVETRARLAAALTAAGRKAEAQALKKVRRPSPSAWATNQVVRRARGEIDAFLAASERLRDSQGAMAAGRGDRGLYQADVEELRGAGAALADAARRILADLGRPEDRALVDRVVANARAASLTDAAREALLGGALGADLDGGGDGFGGLLAAGVGPAPPRPAPPARPAPATAEVSRPAAGPDPRAVEAREREAARDREREAARREEASAREAAAKAEAAAVDARATFEAAQRRVDEAHESLREAERAGREAETTLRKAQREAAEAETRAGRATRRREALEP